MYNTHASIAQKQNYKIKRNSPQNSPSCKVLLICFQGKGRGLLYRRQFPHHIFHLPVLMFHSRLTKCTCVNNFSVSKSKALLIPPLPQNRIRKEMASLHGGQRIEEPNHISQKNLNWLLRLWVLDYGRYNGEIAPFKLIWKRQPFITLSLMARKEKREWFWADSAHI